MRHLLLHLAYLSSLICHIASSVRITRISCLSLPVWLQNLELASRGFYILYALLLRSVHSIHPIFPALHCTYLFRHVYDLFFFLIYSLLAYFMSILYAAHDFQKRSRSYVSTFLSYVPQRDFISDFLRISSDLQLLFPCFPVLGFL